MTKQVATPAEPITDAAARTLISLGLLQPRIGPQEAVAAVSEIGIERAGALLFRHKITSIALQVMAEAGIDLPELVEAIAVASEPMRLRWVSTDSVVDLVDSICTRQGIRWLSMKGISVRWLYPTNRQRDVGDLDVVVDTVRDAWALTRDLRASGYIYLDRELPWLKRDVVTGALYGQVRLTAPDKDRLSIDIHAGPYSIRHCGLMPLERSADLPSGSGLTLDDDLCAVVANAGGDYFVTAKLVNDLALFLAQEVDVPYVRATLDQGGLLPFLGACLAIVEDLCDLQPEQRNRLEQLRSGLSAEPVPSLVVPDAAVRCDVTVAHARRVAARLPDPAVTDEVAESAREAYSSDHPLRIVDASSAQSTVPGELNNWTCVRFVPVEFAAAADTYAHAAAPVPLGEEIARESLDPEITRVTYAAGDLVVAADDEFVPTVDFALSRDLVRAAAARR